MSVFTIAAGAPFGETLALGLVARAGKGAFALADTAIYLPTRRAARNFGEAFARVLGGAALLPQFRALGDSEEEDVVLDGGEGLALKPAITAIRRQLLLAALIRRWETARGSAIGFAHAAALAQSLGEVMDEAERQEADLSRLEHLAPMALAEHWQEAARFLALLRDEWPKLLEAEKVLNPAARRNLALGLLAERLKQRGACGPVIAAGSTGSMPATARLLGVIANLPQGALVLPGLDRELDDESWRKLDPGHPQYGLKQLLERIGFQRDEVKDWHGPPPNSARETLIRESLRPAPTTDAWQALADRGSRDLAKGLDGITLVEAADPGEEALVIALALRETLEHPGKTAALVTPDRMLARRVAAELARWNIAIDDSAGRPLAHTGAGAFLCLIAEAAQAMFAPVPLLALLKHPFACLSEEPRVFRAKVRALDRLALRGPRPDPGLAGVEKRIALLSQSRLKEEREACARLGPWWRRIQAALAPLEQAFAKTPLPLDELIVLHLEAAERLSTERAGECPLWRDVDGEAASLFFAQFRADATALPAFEPEAYAPLLRTLAMAVPVRGNANRHPAIAILGPLEARLQSFDLAILAGLNEGTWPATPAADPWFSRPMRQTLGLEQPERAIGLAAHDFATQASAREVLLTRATKVEGAPTIASRWLQRLNQLTAGLGFRVDEGPFPAAARGLGRVTPQPPQPPPAPRPPVAARPRRVSVTEIETWLRDPYAIYARHVLALDPLEPLDAAIGPLERGTALHRALESFKQRYPGLPPEDGLGKLMAIADEVFENLAIPKAQLAVWRPRFENAARWFLALETRRAPDIVRSVLEIRGERSFAGPGGEFRLTGIADRIDLLKNGKAAILDYKSGKPPTSPQVKDLLTPQLPLEGAILQAGGFPGLDKLAVEDLLYLHISGRGEGGSEQPLPDAAVLIEKAAAKLAQRIASFDDPTTPYPPRVRPFSVESVGDYDHLARVRAWSVSGWEEE